jgi:hypothetical protein
MFGTVTRAIELLCILVAVQAAASPAFAVDTGTANPGAVPTVYVDSAKLPASAVSVIDGMVYVGLRAAGRAFGADVSYSPKKKEVTVTTLLHQSVLRVGTPGGARAVQGRVMVPLRLLAGSLGVGVRYDGKERAVRLSTAGLQELPGNVTAARRGGTANTIEGTVSSVRARPEPAVVDILADQASYSIAIPPGITVQFRDTRGAIAGSGSPDQIKPGDALIATVDAGGHLLSVADIFAGTSGAISAISGASMVLTNGTVINADPNFTAVILDGRNAALGDLAAGDLVTVRANPRTGKVREILALTPRGAQRPAAQTSASSAALRLANVSDDALGPLRAGQTFHIFASGTSGARASFDISNLLLGLRMRETAPGRYQGAYTVEVGTNLVDAPVLVRLQKGADAAVAAADQPLTIITQPPQVKDIAPAAGAHVNTLRPSIYATFATLGGKGMDTGTLHVLVNGKDVSDQSARTAGFASYYPASDLPPGRVSVEVRGSDVAGNALDYRWTFVIGGEQ